MVQGGVIFHIFWSIFYLTYEQGLLIIDNHGMWHIILVYFFPTKMMEIIKSILSIRWENTALGNEFIRNFCARIGPIQLGVVLV